MCAGPTPPPSALALTHLLNLRKGAARLAERLPSVQGHTALSALSSAHLTVTLGQAHCPSCRHGHRLAADPTQVHTQWQNPERPGFSHGCGSSKPAPSWGQHGNRLRWPLTALLVRDLRSASLGQSDAKVSSSRQTLRQKLGSQWTLETSQHRDRLHSQEGQRPSQLCHWVESAYCPEPPFPPVKGRQEACLQLGVLHALIVQ